MTDEPPTSAPLSFVTVVKELVLILTKLEEPIRTVLAVIRPTLSRLLLLKLFAPPVSMPAVKLGLVPAKVAPLVTESDCVVVAPLTVIEDTTRFGATGKTTLPAVMVETLMVL
jgi:hypothetical protein